MSPFLFNLAWMVPRSSEAEAYLILQVQILCPHLRSIFFPCYHLSQCHILWGTLATFSVVRMWVLTSEFLTLLLTNLCLWVQQGRTTIIGLCFCYTSNEWAVFFFLPSINYGLTEVLRRTLMNKNGIFHCKNIRMSHSCIYCQGLNSVEA